MGQIRLLEWDLESDNDIIPQLTQPTPFSRDLIVQARPLLQDSLVEWSKMAESNSRNPWAPPPFPVLPPQFKILTPPIIIFTWDLFLAVKLSFS